MLIKIGLTLYDLYGARHRVMPKHQFFFRRKALEEMPAITPRIVAGGIYYDAKISRPERLVWELVKDGLDASPEAGAANFTTLLGQEHGVLRFCDARGRERLVRAGVVVNAAGPWIDHVNDTLGIPSKLIGGTKGSHILLRNPELVKSLRGRMIYFEADDGRICLVYDFLGLALVGSTDTKADNPETVRCEDDEIDYFLASLRSLLPALQFDRSQIVFAYSGIRPLPASDASQPGLISRDHSAPVAEPVEGRPFPVISLVGGKWTTFRGFAEEVADTVLSRLRLDRKMSTQSLAIGGGNAFPINPVARRAWIDKRSAKSGLPVTRIEALLARYGTTADAVLAHIDAYGSDTLFTDVEGYGHAEIDWIARGEMVEHLADIVLRRTTLAIEGKLTVEALDQIASVAGAALGWDESKRAEEVAAVKKQLASVNRVSF